MALKIVDTINTGSGNASVPSTVGGRKKEEPKFTIPAAKTAPTVKTTPMSAPAVVTKPMTIKANPVNSSKAQISADRAAGSINPI